MNLKRNIYLMYAIALLQGMVFYGPIATLYRQMAGVTVFQITIIESIALALCVFLELPWGIVADKIGYRKTMIICCCLYLISKIVFWKAYGFEAFLIERIILSIVISGLSGVDISMLYMSTTKENSQNVFGIYNNLMTLGLIIASGIYSLFIGDNYRLAGLFTVISYSIAAFLSFGLKEVKIDDESKTKPIREFTRTLGLVFNNKHLILFLIAVALLNETHQTITVFLNQLQYVKSGIPNTTIGYIYIGVTIIGLLGGLSSKLTRRLGVKCFANILFALSTIACVTLACSYGKILSVMSILLLRLSFSLFQPLQTTIQNRQIASTNRATELSVNSVIIHGIAIATNIVFGKLADINLSYSMMLGAVFCFSSFILFSIWYKKCGHVI